MKYYSKYQRLPNHLKHLTAGVLPNSTEKLRHMWYHKLFTQEGTS